MGSTDELDQLLRPGRAPSSVDAARAWAAERRWWIAAGAALAVVATLLVVPRGDSDAVGGLPVASSGASGGVAAAGGATPADAAASTALGGASTTTTLAELAVHVAGAVNVPGVVRVSSAARVVDAIAAAGGPRGDADLNRINLASPLHDGSWIYVPALGETAVPTVPPGTGTAGTGTAGSGTAGSGTAGSGPDNVGGSSSGAPAAVNINTATAQELETLPGIGPATAAAIVAHRDKAGPFRSPAALDDVRGIGPAKVEALLDLVVVE